MGQTIGVNVAQRAYDVDISPQFDGYSAVRIYVGTDDKGDSVVYEAGDTTGRTLEINNDFGTQQMADDILESIRGYQYQPLTANNALLDPATEMGDGVTVNGVYSGLYVRATTFGRLMASDISAPTDQEIAHEYSVDTASSDRAFSRFVASTRSAISLTSSEIRAEVTRATTAEEELSGRIDINEGEISATVTKVDKKLDQTQENSSFGWDLTSTSFSINADNSKNIFYADKDGITIRGNAEVTGKITATSGYIGGTNGFTINATSIYNGRKSLKENTDSRGIYIGTDGISLGSKASTDAHAKFEVDSAGNLYAQSGTFAGSVYAKNIKSGGTTYGYFDGSGIANDSIYGYSKIADGTVYGGVDYWGDATGAIATSTVASGNTSFTSTLQQVGTNTSNIYTLATRVASIQAGYFNSISTSNIATSSLLLGDYYLFVGSDNIVRGSWAG